MSIFADLLSNIFDRRYRFGLAREDDRTLSELTDDLVSASGDVTGQAVARQILDRYARWDDAEKLDFFRHMALGMDLDPQAVRVALDAYEASPGKTSYRVFMAAAEPPRQELVRRLNQVPGATHLLVSMRSDLLRLGREDNALMALDLDLRHLFASWFNRGFLVLRPISWESPAHILEKIIAYEAVHAIDSWNELRRRLQPADRRCFAFFHPSMPDDPLIFVEVALTKGVPGSIQTLLAEGRSALAPEQADTAVFYSISNCQSGLAGISFGNSLIKQVAADLSAQLPGLKTFVTLSPIPGFVRWLGDQDLPDSTRDDTTLRQLAAYYLTRAKRDNGKPLDPVARFHLGNGAVVHALHAGADTSPKGRAQSEGVMVNYLYDLARVSQNHEKFASDGVIATSPDLRSLAQAGEARLKETAP
ncbi:malonyl-CoA decarboxylase [Primorskyibacter flagellatus]|uniref:malonyl-CoA decarboxylase n=1 Tax=Primorskyibacter flagellatus TaxID=1387277 RepID=UPI003A9580DB